MTYQQVASLVASIGLPYAYDHFTDDTEHAPPFVCFIYPGSDDFIADNRNYVKVRRLQIELYTENKDFDLEAQVEDVLKEAGFPYTEQEGYLKNELMYMHTYNTEVLING